MKKILLACFIALGIGANAQLNYNGDFETVGTQYGQFGGGTTAPEAACGGLLGGQIAISNAVPNSGWFVNTENIPQVSNGQKVNLTVNYKKPAGFVGTISLAYFIKDPVSGSYSVNLVGPVVPLTAAAITTCTPLAVSIPAGILQPSASIGLGVWVVKGTGGVNGNVYVDDINFVQDTSVTTPPACTSFTAPLAGSTISGGNAVFSWTAPATAVNYKVMVGTTSGASDVYNATVAGTSANISLPINTTLYAKVVASNGNGDATGCTEITFNTNAMVAYCGPITSTSPAATYPISSVTFAGKGPKTSSAAVGSPAYEDFTAYTFDVALSSTNALSVTGTGVGANRFGMTVFVDWNSNGNFDDAGEQYFTTPATFLGGTGAAITLTGNIAVPSGTAIGAKRMRIKYNFSSSTTALNPALANGCSQMTNGQTEDYTINLVTTLGTSAVAKAAVSVYPNPFKDVLKISDVKGVKSISISDVSGRQVKNMTPSTELDLSSLKSGLYIVTLRMEDGTVNSIKAIKK